LTRDGINPHRLKVGRDIFLEKLVEVFGKGTPRFGFCYIECRDPQVKAKVEKFWPFYYGKAKMPCSKLIVKGFALEIVAREKCELGYIYVRNQHKLALQVL
jgi:hypothetical protein